MHRCHRTIERCEPHPHKVCHWVRNDGLEKSDEVKLGYNDHGQLYLTISTDPENGDDQIELTPRYTWKYSCSGSKK